MLCASPTVATMPVAMVASGVYPLVDDASAARYRRRHPDGCAFSGRHDLPACRHAQGVADILDSHGLFVWYELLTTDIAAAEAFYADVVGWGRQEASSTGPAYTHFTAAEAPVAGLTALPEEARRGGAPAQWIGYVSVADVDAAASRIRQLGGFVHVPPTRVPGVGHFSIVADPQMATLALVEGREPADPSVQPIAPGLIGWHELLAADSETVFAFYAALFGWQKGEAHVNVMGRYQAFSAGKTPIGGMFTKPASLPFPFWLYYINTSDIVSAAARVVAAGGQVIYGPMEVEGGALMLQGMDPQGAIFALLERPVRKAVGYSIGPRDPSSRPGGR